MIGQLCAYVAVMLTLDAGLHVWLAAGGVAGARARDAERRRQRHLAERHGSVRYPRRHR